MTERLFVLDAPGYVYRAYHALHHLSISKGLPSHVMLGTSTMVWKLLREETPEYFGAAGADLPRGEVRRVQGDAPVHPGRPARPDSVRAAALRGALTYPPTLRRCSAANQKLSGAGE
jgi:DNA polymerase-1